MYRIESFHSPERVGGIFSTNHKAYGWQVFGEISWRSRVSDSFSLEPFAGPSYNVFRSDMFSETGIKETRVRTGHSSQENIFSTLGLRGYFRLNDTVRLYGMGGCRRAFGDITGAASDFSGLITGGTSFYSSDSAIAKDTDLARIGAIFSLSPSSSLSLSYAGQYNQRVRAS